MTKILELDLLVNDHVIDRILKIPLIVDHVKLYPIEISYFDLFDYFYSIFVPPYIVGRFGRLFFIMKFTLGRFGRQSKEYITKKFFFFVLKENRFL